MEDFESYKFTQKEYKKLAKLVDYLYNLTIILNYFCSTQKEIEELSNLTPLTRYMKKIADYLNCVFMEYPNKEWLEEFRF